MSIEYSDAYLGTLVERSHEARALEYVNNLGTFSQAWVDELVRLRVYILVCIEHQAEAEDLFSVKRGVYNDLFSAALQDAKNAAADNAGNQRPALFSIPLERG